MDILKQQRQVDCYGYIRVSTIKQSEKGISLETQEDQINQYVAYKKYNLIHTYKDKGISGRSMKKRDDLQKLLTVIKEGDIIIVFSLSRLSRSLRDMLKLFDEINGKKADVVSLHENIDTSSAMGKFTFHLFSALSQLESDTTSERVTANMVKLKENKRFYGRIPYGYKLKAGKGSDLVPDDIEGQIVISIVSLKKEGKSYAEIISQLNDWNVPPPNKSKVWYTETIKRIIAIQENGGPVRKLGRLKSAED